jgi:gallate decarboxylase subunit D
MKFGVGKGRCRLTAHLVLEGSNPVLIIGGGAKHVGAVALSEPLLSGKEPHHARVSLLAREGHREDELATKAAQRLADATGEAAVICMGIHLDKITKEEIEEVRKNTDRLVDLVIDRLAALIGPVDL